MLVLKIRWEAQFSTFKDLQMPNFSLLEKQKHWLSCRLGTYLPICIIDCSFIIVTHNDS